MSGAWWLDQTICNGTDAGSNTAASLGTSLTSGGSADTKGAWTQLIASTSEDSVYLVIYVGTLDTTSTDGTSMIDIGIGPSGSEIPIVSNLVFSCGPISGQGYAPFARYAFPCCIPAGTRISARCQAHTASQTCYAAVMLADGSFDQLDGASIIDTIGFGTIHGTAVDPGATINTKGAYAQLTASTSYDISGFVIGFDVLNQTISSTGHIYELADLAIGPSGSEQIILPNMILWNEQDHANGFYWIAPNNTEFIPMSIPAGTRIAARAQSAVATSPERQFGITLYGLRA